MHLSMRQAWEIGKEGSNTGEGKKGAGSIVTKRQGLAAKMQGKKAIQGRQLQ